AYSTGEPVIAGAPRRRKARLASATSAAALPPIAAPASASRREPKSERAPSPLRSATRREIVVSATPATANATLPPGSVAVAPSERREISPGDEERREQQRGANRAQTASVPRTIIPTRRPRSDR